MNLDDRPDLEATIVRPGQRLMTNPRQAPTAGRKTTRFLGLPDRDFFRPTKPPYAYFIERPAGDVTPDHAHDLDPKLPEEIPCRAPSTKPWSRP